MKRLIAFGCSNTYGEALYDIFDQEYNSCTSEYAWPNVLAGKVDKQCVNMGECGASNKKICYNIHNFDFQPDDIVVIMWTYLNRSCILHKNPERIIRLAAFDIAKRRDELPENANGKLSKMFFKMFENDFESCYVHYCRVNLAKTFLDNLGLINLHISPIKKNSILDCQAPRWNQVDIKNFYRYTNIDRAEDNIHPGVKSHKAIASEIFKLL